MKNKIIRNIKRLNEKYNISIISDIVATSLIDQILILF